MAQDERNDAQPCACAVEPLPEPTAPLRRCAAQDIALPMAASQAASRRVCRASNGPSPSTVAIMVILAFLACWLFAQFKGYGMLDKLIAAGGASGAT